MIMYIYVVFMWVGFFRLWNAENVYPLKHCTSWTLTYYITKSNQKFESGYQQNNKLIVATDIALIYNFTL